VLNCEGLLEVNLHTSVSYCVVIALSFYIAWAFLLVSAALLQGTYSKIERHISGQRMRQKIASREGWASSVKTLVVGRVSCTRAGLSRLSVQKSSSSVRKSGSSG